MKYISKLIFLLSFIFLYELKSEQVQNDLKNDPLLVVVLMVKNEEDVINATIEPFIKAGIDSYFIFDTGSTDKTVETVKKFF